MSGTMKKRKEKSQSREESTAQEAATSSSFSDLLDAEKPLAVMKASISRKALHSIEFPRQKPTQRRSSSSTSDSKQTPTVLSAASKQPDSCSDVMQVVVEDIWKNLECGKIELGYAIVGYSCNGRPVVDHDVLVTLLINYGYKIDHILAFIDDFNAVSEDDSGFPMIVVNSSVSRIYEEVEPLSDSIYKKFGEN